MLGETFDTHHHQELLLQCMHKTAAPALASARPHLEHNSDYLPPPSPPSPPLSYPPLSPFPSLPAQNPIRYGPWRFEFTSDSDAKPTWELSLSRAKDKNEKLNVYKLAKFKVHVWLKVKPDKGKVPEQGPLPPPTSASNYHQGHHFPDTI